MKKTLLMACAVAGGLFVALAAPPPAQALPSVNLSIEKNAHAVMPVARRGGRGFRGGRAFRGGRGFRGRGYRRGRVYGYRGRRYRGRSYRRGRVYGYRGYRGRRYRGRRYRRGRVYGYYYGGGCAWLRRRAYATGSAYWWRRYNRCRYYY